MIDSVDSKRSESQWSDKDPLVSVTIPKGNN
jgi:hypothetical protein